MSPFLLRTRKLLPRLAVVTCALIVALGLCEGALRLFWTPSDIASSWPNGEHPEYLKALLPGATGRIVRGEFSHSFENSLQGLRGRQIYSRVRPADKSARVLVIGDSFVYGLGVEEADTFVSQLRKRRPDIEFINAGCPGWGTHEELMFLDRMGEALKPDVVVLAFFANDPSDNLRPRPTFEIDSGGRVRRTDTNGIVRAEDPLALQRAVPAGVIKHRSAPYLVHLWNQARANVKAWWFPDKATTLDQLNNDWPKTRNLLNLFAIRTKELGAKLFVVYVPYAQEIDPDGRHPHRPYDHLPIGDYLAAACTELEVPLIDLRPALKQAQSQPGLTLYWHTDVHWSPRAHAVAAETIGPALDPLLPPH